jgi:DNA-binding GntR family transcriptional regulator
LGSLEEARAPELEPLIEGLRGQHASVINLAATAVRQAIVAGLLPAGTHVSQNSIAQIIGTSRTSIRHALWSLEREGLLAFQPHRGFRVTALSHPDIVELVDLLTLLEAHAIELALPSLSIEDVEDLERACLDVRASSTVAERIERRDEFYVRLFSTTGRRRLVQFLMELRRDVERALGPRLDCVEDQLVLRLLEAIREGNVELAIDCSKSRRAHLSIRREIREPRQSGRSRRGRSPPSPHRLAGGQ